EAVGVGGFFENEPRHPGFRLRMMRLLGGLSSLTPGAYCRSGITVPLRLLTPDSPLVAVDRLSGACMAWRGAIAREIRFEESFYGYAQSEDTLFSRLAASYGELLICPMAQCEHLQEASGRPDLVQQARMKIFNRYFIHQRVVPNRALRDVLWFFYANFLDIMLVSTALFLRGKLRSGFAYMYGSLLGLKDIYDTA
ncbi:MAG: hypothetical protein JXA10_09530, partial [Anaerolineae bacterium]|nr:hypothetical protein [Anaerolineae bacterium]